MSSVDPKKIVASLLTQYEGDATQAVNQFHKESEIRFVAGGAPNKNFSIVSKILSELAPLQDDVDKLDTGKRITKNKIFDNLIFNNVRRMNELLGDEVYEYPEAEKMDQAAELHGYEQAVIQLESALPHVSKNELEDVMWNIGMLNQIIQEIKLGLV